jgi:hypothetical protein
MEHPLAVVEQHPHELTLPHAPKVVLEEATKAAKALNEVLRGKSKPVILNGDQYLEFEDWQTVGQFYGCSVRTHDAEPFEVGGMAGAKAKADLLDRHGNVVGGAESYCLRDEPNWSSKPWFQLASMAQTRAGAKALRNRFAWVVVLAGYRPTPAEEMQDVYASTHVDKMTFPRGKFAGKTPIEVDTGYLDWYLDKVKDGDPALYEAVKIERANRNTPTNNPAQLAAFAEYEQKIRTLPKAEAQAAYKEGCMDAKLSEDQKTVLGDIFNERFTKK